jgi:hypothetical protein
MPSGGEVLASWSGACRLEDGTLHLAGQDVAVVRG